MSIEVTVVSVNMVVGNSVVEVVTGDPVVEDEEVNPDVLLRPLSVDIRHPVVSPLVQS